MTFHENLILRVQNYKEIYDLSNRYYSNHQRKEEIWREIAEQIGETSDICKETWRKLRDNYRKAKQLRKTKSGQGAKKIKRIKFEKELAFLNPHLQQPQELQASNLSVPDSDDEDDADDPTQKLTEEFSEPATPDSVKSSSSASTSRLNSKLKRKREHVQQSPMQEYLQFKREQKVSQQQSKHPLDVFFSSMAATVKTFPAPLQLSVKQQVFKIVTDTEATLINPVSIDNAIPGPSQYAGQPKTSAPSLHSKKIISFIPGPSGYASQTISSVTPLQPKNVVSGTPGPSGYAGHIRNENQSLNLGDYETLGQSYYHTVPHNFSK